MNDNNGGILKILIIVFAVLDAIVLIGGGIYLLTASKSVESIQLTPAFTETELNINSEYTFSLEAAPGKASLKKAEASCDNMNVAFEISKDGESATLYTGGAEGTVTVYVEYKDVQSNVLTYQIVDAAARAAEEAAAEAAAAEAEAAAAAEAEAAAAEEAANAKMYVMMTGDNVNVRSQNNTDCDILGKAKKGQTFEKVETVDDWTHIMYNGQDGYIKSEYLKEVTEEEAMSAQSQTTTETKKEETKTEETKTEETKTEETTQSDEEKAKAAEAAAAEAAQKAAEELAAQQAALAAAAAAAGPTIECADGTHTFTQAQYNFLKGFWWREGQTSEDDWKVYAHKHTYAECIQICQIEGGL